MKSPFAGHRGEEFIIGLDEMKETMVVINNREEGTPGRIIAGDDACETDVKQRLPHIQTMPHGG